MNATNEQAAASRPLSAFWRYPEAARYLGISPATLRRKVMERAIPFYRPFGRSKSRVLFDPSELAAMVRRSRVGTLSEEIEQERRGAA